MLTTSMIAAYLLPLVATTALQDQFPKEALPFVGRWDLTIQTANGPRPAWLEIEPSGYFVVGRFVGAFGSARPVAALKIEKDTIRFEIPRQWEKRDIAFEAKLDQGELRGGDRQRATDNRSDLGTSSAGPEAEPADDFRPMAQAL